MNRITFNDDVFVEIVERIEALTSAPLEGNPTMDQLMIQLNAKLDAAFTEISGGEPIDFLEGGISLTGVRLIPHEGTDSMYLYWVTEFTEVQVDFEASMGVMPIAVDEDTVYYYVLNPSQQSVLMALDRLTGAVVSITHLGFVDYEDIRGLSEGHRHALDNLIALRVAAVDAEDEDEDLEDTDAP